MYWSKTLLSAVDQKTYHHENRQLNKQLNDRYFDKGYGQLQNRQILWLEQRDPRRIMNNEFEEIIGMAEVKRGQI